MRPSGDNGKSEWRPEPQKDAIAEFIPATADDTTRPSVNRISTRDIIGGGERDSVVARLSSRIKRLETLAGGSINGVQLSTDAAAPPAPTIVTGSTVNGSFRFRFKAVDNPLVAGYNVYRSNQETNPGVAEFAKSIAQSSDPSHAILNYDSAEDGIAALAYWVCSYNQSGVESPRVRAIANKAQWDKKEEYSIEEYGAVCNGVTDDTIAIQSAIDAAYANGGGKVIFPGGCSTMALSLLLKSNVSIEATGATITKFGGAASTHIVDMLGTEGTATALTGNAAINDTHIDVTDSSIVAAGDYVLIRDSTYAYTTYGRNQELNRVASVSAGIINFDNRLIRSYATASSAEVLKIIPIIDASIHGGKWIVPAATNGGNIYGDLTYGILLQDVELIGPNDDPGAYFTRSAYCEITDITAKDGQNQSSGGYGYGVYFGESSHGCSVRHSYFENLRENGVTDGTRFCEFVDSLFISHYDNAINSHGTGNHHVTFSDNTIMGGSQYGIAIGYSSHPAPDVDVVVTNNKISNTVSSGISVASPNSGLLNHQHVLISGNKIYNVIGGYDAMTVRYSDHVQICGNKISMGGAAYGLQVVTSTNVGIYANHISNGAAGYGLAINTSCDRITIVGNLIEGIASTNIREIGTNTNVFITNNVTDDYSNVINATTFVAENMWGSTPDVIRKFNQRVFIGNVTDDTTSQAQVQGVTHLYDNLYISKNANPYIKMTENASAQTNYIQIASNIFDFNAASGTSARFSTGVYSLTLNADGGVTVGAPTGGSKGSGTLNTAAAIYVNGTAAGGDFTSDVSVSVDSEIVLFSSTTGKHAKRATGTGIVKATSGVYSVLTDPLPLANGGTAATSAANALTSLGAAAAASITAGSIPLAKITPGGADGSIDVNVQGIVTAYTAPT